ncbi:MAG: tyrosine--tRNA ligase, partial [Dehalococcoidia bacterium]|nr:tyrosine--tRNA ligase [Dehalococcoidia bacterium]
ILIVGDWTAQIGDPSGESQTRPMLSPEEVRTNAETYMKQFFKVVAREKTRVVWQSEWFGKFNLGDVIGLASKFTVAQMLQRDDFSKRYASGRPIAITEFLYPLLQAYDSVEIEADVEFGGTDQKFNCLVGRELQQMTGQPPQQVFLVPLLVGTDGSMKMSKSLGNYISIDESPDDIYGKVMSIPDELMMDYFELLTDVSDEELAEFRRKLATESINPMILKKRLARELVEQFHSKKAAQDAEKHFEKVVQKKEAPDEIRVFLISFKQLREEAIGQTSEAVPMSDRERIGNMMMLQTTAIKDGRELPTMLLPVAFILPRVDLTKSRSEAKRLLEQGAVEVDGEKLTENLIGVYDGIVIKVGKRRFVKIVNTDKRT